ncbi:MAG: hypothetical protein K1X78_22255 [Verrucomicrobiaceae bacterium]|nr:hypothetical protein [Verrucomicrobiaceae bacterium]
MKPDPILRGFLEAQFASARQLAEQSDIIDIMPLPPFPPERYLLHFKCGCLRGASAADLRAGDHVTVGIAFPPDYLRRIDAGEVVTLMDPPDLWHPNVRAPFICVGDLSPGTTLTDLAHQIYEIVTFQKRNTIHGLNHLAIEWARGNQDRLPVDPRPLRRPVRSPKIDNMEVQP